MLFKKISEIYEQISKFQNSEYAVLLDESKDPWKSKMNKRPYNQTFCSLAVTETKLEIFTIFQENFKKFGAKFWNYYYAILLYDPKYAKIRTK
jgi:hypothetical protein